MAATAPAAGRLLATADPARTDVLVRRTATGTLAAALLLVTAWWLQDGGLRDLLTPAAALTSSGRLTGLVASVLLLAQVLLMARVPALERAYGQDRLTRIHRVVGFTSFTLMVVHVVTITWGYAGNALLRTPAELWRLTRDYPAMLLADAGTLALVLVAVTSLRAARRRLRYESWHLLHLYAYLGVGLALPHQLWTGTDFSSSPTRTLFWWTAWGVTAATVLVLRVLRPLVQNLVHSVRVTSVVGEAPGVVSVYLTGRRLDRLDAEPGQFLLWRFLGRPGWTRANPYSLSAAPDGHSLRITVQADGDGSASVARLRPGTRVLLEGPFGRLNGRARTRDRVAFIGAGVGMAPLRSLAEGLEYAPGEAVYVERYTAEPLFRDEVDVLSAERGLHVLRLPGHRRAPESWLGAGLPPVDDVSLLRHWIPDVAERDVYVCGPEAWSALVRRSLLAAGLPPAQLHLETFGW